MYPITFFPNTTQTFQTLKQPLPFSETTLVLESNFMPFQYHPLSFSNSETQSKNRCQISKQSRNKTTRQWGAYIIFEIIKTIGQNKRPHWEAIKDLIIINWFQTPDTKIPHICSLTINNKKNDNVIEVFTVNISNFCSNSSLNCLQMCVIVRKFHRLKTSDNEYGFIRLNMWASFSFSLFCRLFTWMLLTAIEQQYLSFLFSS